MREVSRDSLASAKNAAVDARVPLSQLQPGERGRVHTENLCCEDCDLLTAMGLTEQCEIRVCRRDTANGPCIVQVNSTRLGLSAALARNLMVSRA